MKKLNSNYLKIIAIIAMTIDHLADLLYPNMQNNIVPIILHVIGRLTAPIMFFFICEGYYYTKNLKIYNKIIYLCYNITLCLLFCLWYKLYTICYW